MADQSLHLKRGHFFAKFTNNYEVYTMPHDSVLGPEGYDLQSSVPWLWTLVSLRGWWIPPFAKGCPVQSAGSICMMAEIA